MQNPELFACLSKERKENLLGTLLFRPSIYERLYYEEEMVRKQIVCYEEFLQIVRNPQIRAAAPEIDFEFEEFSSSPLSMNIYTGTKYPGTFCSA